MIALTKAARQQRAIQEELSKRERLAQWDEQFREWGELTRFTPDYQRLEQQNWNIFLICDDMMGGHEFHSLLHDEAYARKLYGVTYTQNSYVMFRKNLGKFSYPVFLDPEQITSPGTIKRTMGEPCIVKGELWAIRPSRVLELDKHRLNTVEFLRRRVSVDIPFKRVVRFNSPKDGWEGDKLTDVLHYKNQRAWMYFGIPEAWQFQSWDEKSLSPVKPIEPNSRTMDMPFKTEEEAKIFAASAPGATITHSQLLDIWTVTFEVRHQSYYFFKRPSV